MYLELGHIGGWSAEREDDVWNGPQELESPQNAGEVHGGSCCAVQLDRDFLTICGSLESGFFFNLESGQGN